MTLIERIHAREVYDSRGKPTVEVDVACVGGRTGRAIVPSGASTGRFEALELRDHDSRLDGFGVRTAVENVNREIAPALVGRNADDQEDIDRRLCELDGTDNKSRLGANAILGVSLATAYAVAEARNVGVVHQFYDIWNRIPSTQTDLDDATQPGDSAANLGTRMLLPLPMVNMISGGLHAGGNLDFQDYLILPVGAGSYREAFEWIVTVYRTLGRLLTDSGYEGVLVGDEGGYGPKLKNNHEALELIIEAINKSGLKPGTDVCLGLDVASTHFYTNGTYRLSATGNEELNADDVINLLTKWVDEYPIISIEDGLAEDDWDGWRKLTERIGHRVQLIGDDLFVTNSRRLQRGIDTSTANGVLVKLNQIGTLWETLQTIRLAIDNGYWPIVSARSGETEDATIADLVVATGAGQLKVGSVARSERLVKYNQLLRLEEQLADNAEYIGGTIFDRLV